MTQDRTDLRRRLIYLALVFLFCFAWASGFTVAKIAQHVAPPALFGGIRFLTAGALLLGYAAWRGELRGRIPWVSLCVLGLFNQAGYQGLAWQGMGTVSAGLTTIIASLNPILIAAIAAPLLGERLHWRKVMGLLLGFAGAVFVVRHRIAGGGEDPAGLLMVVGALVSMVIGTLAFKMLAPTVSLAVAVGGAGRQRRRIIAGTGTDLRGPQPDGDGAPNSGCPWPGACW